MCRTTAGEIFLEGEAEQRGGILRVRLRLCAGHFVIAAFKHDYPLDWILFNRSAWLGLAAEHRDPIPGPPRRLFLDRGANRGRGVKALCKN